LEKKLQSSIKRTLLDSVRHLIDDFSEIMM